MLETILITIGAIYFIFEMHEMSMKYFSFYEKFIFSVNIKPIFYGLTTKYVTIVLHNHFLANNW